jgi:hypothetical protein
MGEVEDRVVGLLPVDAVQLQPLSGLEPVEDHLARLAHRGKLRGIAEEDEGGKISVRSSNWRASSMELSSTKPMSSGLSRRFHPVMKSDPRRPAEASAAGTDFVVS